MSERLEYCEDCGDDRLCEKCENYAFHKYIKLQVAALRAEVAALKESLKPIDRALLRHDFDIQPEKNKNQKKEKSKVFKTGGGTIDCSRRPSDFSD